MPNCGDHADVTKMTIYNRWVLDNARRVAYENTPGAQKLEDIYYVDNGFSAYYYVACSASPEPCSE